MEPTPLKDPAAAVLSRLASRADRTYASRRAERATETGRVFLGIRMPEIRTVARETYAALAPRGAEDVLAGCESLLETGIEECKSIAFIWARLITPSLDPDHVAVFDRWMETHLRDWDDADVLGIQVVGPYLLMTPDAVHAPKVWARHDRWQVRRAASSCLVPAAKTGRYQDHVLDVAELLYRDPVPLVRMGAARLLATAARAWKDVVESFLRERRRVVPPSVLRRVCDALPEGAYERIKEDPSEEGVCRYGGLYRKEM
ncbi:MAG: DNA alkylation repair protein [Candidatus Methanofastidiosa archaeon]|nr:DNA alkylation repair protein [Candidatus Methanofastidiosa archaeon]